MLRVVCCVLHAICRMLRVVCCMLRLGDRTQRDLRSALAAKDELSREMQARIDEVRRMQHATCGINPAASNLPRVVQQTAAGDMQRYL